MRAAEYHLQFPSFPRVSSKATPAQLAQRERLMLYAFVVGLAPRRCLEIGSFYGGSAAIISGALDDVQRGGRLLCIDPEPGQIRIDWTTIAHNAELVGGYFPTDLPATWLGEPTRGLFEFVFYDGPHTEAQGVANILPGVYDLMAPGAFVLIHDLYHVDTRKAVADFAASRGMIDCGIVTRVCNDTVPGPFYGGLGLLRKPGEMPSNSD